MGAASADPGRVDRARVLQLAPAAQCGFFSAEAARVLFSRRSWCRGIFDVGAFRLVAPRYRSQGAAALNVLTRTGFDQGEPRLQRRCNCVERHRHRSSVRRAVRAGAQFGILEGATHLERHAEG